MIVKVNLLQEFFFFKYVSGKEVEEAKFILLIIKKLL